MNLQHIFFLGINSKWLNSFVLKKLAETDPAFCPNNCGHSYRGNSRKAHLKRHLIYECGVPKRFQCDMCLRKFSYNISLQKHYNVCTKKGLDYNIHNMFFN